MTPENFCYWLQGFVESNPSKILSIEQQMIVRDHLALVFDKVTPDRSATSPNDDLTEPEEIDMPDVPVPAGPLLAEPSLYC